MPYPIFPRGSQIMSQVLFSEDDGDDGDDGGDDDSILGGISIDIGMGNVFHVIPPSTCTFSRWAQEGVCEFQSNFIKEVLDLDILLQVSIKSCQSNGLPTIAVTCLGTQCVDVFELYNLQPCNVDTDCPYHELLNQTCQNKADFSILNESKNVPYSPVKTTGGPLAIKPIQNPNPHI